jgi:hypothetical protein
MTPDEHVLVELVERRLHVRHLRLQRPELRPQLIDPRLEAEEVLNKVGHRLPKQLNILDIRGQLHLVRTRAQLPR